MNPDVGKRRRRDSGCGYELESVKGALGLCEYKEAGSLFSHQPEISRPHSFFYSVILSQYFVI